MASQANQLAEQGGTAVQKSIESMEQIRASSQQISRDHPGDLRDRQPDEPLGAERGDRGGPRRRARHGFRRRGRRGPQAGRTEQPGRRRDLDADQGIDAARARRRPTERSRPASRCGRSSRRAEATAGKIAEIATATVEQAGNAQRGLRGDPEHRRRSPSNRPPAARKWPPAAKNSAPKPARCANWSAASRSDGTIRVGWAEVYVVKFT